MNRRKVLKAAIFGASGLSIAGVAHTASGTETPATSASLGRGPAHQAVDWILREFKKKDIVALGEGDHGLQEFHDFTMQLICHPDFTKSVDAIAVEWGNPLYQETADAYVNGDPVKLSDVQLTWRNTCVSPVQTWDAPVYHRLLSAVKAVNLSEGRSLRMILADSPIDWNECRALDDLMPHLMARDDNMAKVVGDAAASGMKVLFLAGGAHIAQLGAGPRTAGMQLRERLPGKVLTVETHCNVAPEHAAEVEGLLKNWPRPGIGRLADTLLGSRPATWFFPGVQPAPEGKASTAPPPAGADTNATLAETVDAYLWLKERANLTRSIVDPAVYLSKNYWTELERRNGVIPFPADIEKYRTEADPLFFPATNAS